MRSFFSLPLITLKIVVIRLEAVRLWLEGAGPAPRANAAAANITSTGLAIGKHDDYTGPALTTRGGALWSSEGRN
jgi:hypothetical protein